MPSSVAQQSVLFPELFSRPLSVVFDEPQSTSDGGAILLKALDRTLGLTEQLASCLQDCRQPGKVRHEVIELLRQRIFALACGYEDANDAARLAHDPMQKLLVFGDARDHAGLASQPTVSRFENAVSRTDLFRMGSELASLVVERHRRRLGSRRVKRVTIDMDATEDPTHGTQQLTMFNGYYDTWCYLPLLGFVTFNDEAEQYLFAALLRPGTATKAGVLPLLKRAVREIRRAFPRAAIRIRMDAGFAAPELLEFCESEGLEYLIAVGGNPVLRRLSQKFMQRARRDFKSCGRTVQVYGEVSYSARTWAKLNRRVIVKAEVLTHEGREPLDNRRYVITNLPHSPKRLYHEYVQRGDSENRIKELKDGVQIDRTSCTSFLANQFRVLISSAAFVFFQELRLRAARTEHGRAQVTWLRLKLFKIAGKVVSSVRRLVLRLSQHHPWAETWLAIARSCGAQPG